MISLQKKSPVLYAGICRDPYLPPLKKNRFDFQIEIVEKRSETNEKRKEKSDFCF